MYTKIIFSDLTAQNAWENHVRERFDESKELRFVDAKYELDLLDGVLISPSIENGAAKSATPDISVRELLNLEAPKKIWSQRPDLISECCEYISDLLLEEEFLVCEAGFKKVGDKSLSEHRYFSIGEKVFLYTNSREINEIREVLLSSRSWRFIGIICASVGSFEGKIWDLSPRYFICDAFDNDSLFLAKLFYN